MKTERSYRLKHIFGFWATGADPKAHPQQARLPAQARRRAARPDPQYKAHKPVLERV